jgi:magnesium-protoporphyrin IX monomethyl ester (oxidative) cyclase
MVFVTHSLTVYERSGFYHSLGIDPIEFDRAVVRNTNETAANAFSVVLDTEHPDFYPRLQRCAELNLKALEINRQNQLQIVKFFRKLPLQMEILWHIIRLYLMTPIDAQAQWATVK